MKIIWIIALLVAVCVSSSSSLRCYTCDVPGDSKCEDEGLSRVYCLELSDTEKALGYKTACLKLVAQSDGIKRIGRVCSMTGGPVNACSLFGSSVDHCSLCETDLCNKSSYVLASILSVVLPVVAVMFMKLFSSASGITFA